MIIYILIVIYKIVTAIIIVQEKFDGVQSIDVDDRCLISLNSPV